MIDENSKRVTMSIEQPTVEGRLADLIDTYPDDPLMLGICKLSAEDRAVVVAALRVVAGMDHWRHKKRGTTYRRIASTTIETEGFVYNGDKVEVYLADIDGTIWVRRTQDFFDGRFEKLEKADD